MAKGETVVFVSTRVSFESPVSPALGDGWRKIYSIAGGEESRALDVPIFLHWWDGRMKSGKLFHYPPSPPKTPGIPEHEPTCTEPCPKPKSLGTASYGSRAESGASPE